MSAANKSAPRHQANDDGDYSGLHRSHIISPRQRRRTIKWVYVSAISAIVGAGCLVGGVLNLLVIKLGADEAYLGLLSFATIVPFAAGVFTISLIERVGKKRVLFGWLAVSSLLAIPFILTPVFRNVFGWSAGTCLVIILFATFFRTLTAAFGLTGWFPILQDNVPRQITGRFFGRLRTVWQAANFLFILFVAFFFGKNTDWWKFEVVFVVAFVLLIVRAVAILPMSENRTILRSDKRPGFISRLREIWRIKSLRIAAIYLFVYFIAACAPLPFFIKLLKDLGYGDGIILAATSMASLGAIVSLRWWGKLADSFGNHAIFSMSHVGIIIVMLAWLLVEKSTFGIILVFILYFMWSIFNSGNGVAQTRLLFHFTPEDKQYYISMINMIANLGAALGPLLAGLFLHLMRDVSFSSGGVNLTSYHIFFVADAALFVVPHLLRHQLRGKKDLATGHVFTIVTRPLRGAIGPFLNLGIPGRKKRKRKDL